MTRRYFCHWNPEARRLDVRVVFDDKHFWAATFGADDGTSKRTRLLGSSSGLLSLTREGNVELSECEEEEFWKGTGHHMHFIRWAISAYAVHLLQGDPPPG